MIITKKMKGEIHGNGERKGSDEKSIPALCLTCQCYFSDDWFEKILCKTNRKENNNGKKFNCKAYLKM